MKTTSVTDDKNRLALRLTGLFLRTGSVVSIDEKPVAHVRIPEIEMHDQHLRVSIDEARARPVLLVGHREAVDVSIDEKPVGHVR